MTEHKRLEGRIKDALRPILISFQDETLLGEISRRLVQRVEFIESLDNSYHPMDDLVQQFYHQVEQELTQFRQYLLFNPKSARGILKSKSAEADRYDILRGVVEGLLKYEAQAYYTKFRLQTQHFAHHLLASFSSVRGVVEGGETDIAVAIGPEGFMYANIFELLGFPVRNIHIDEYSTTEDRPYKELDDISGIRGEHVLFIEDDVRTGKTLKKAHDRIRKYSPASVSVYLGIPESRQNLQNVPREFRKVYTTPNSLTDGQIKAEVDRAREILERKYPIFKR